MTLPMHVQEKTIEERHVFKGEWITTKELCNLAPVNVFHRQLEKTEIISQH